MHVPSITQEEKCFKAWQLISCRWITGTVKWRALLLTSAILRFLPFVKKGVKNSLNSPVKGIWKGCGASLALLCILYEVLCMCFNFFTLRPRLPHHRVSAEWLKECLIVVYCFGDWGTLLIRWRLFFLLFMHFWERLNRCWQTTVCHHQLFWNATVLKAIFCLPGSLLWRFVEPPLQNLERRLISMLVKYRCVSLYSEEPVSSASPVK